MQTKVPIIITHEGAARKSNNKLLEPGSDIFLTGRASNGKPSPYSEIMGRLNIIEEKINKLYTKDKDEEEWLTKEEAADFLGVHLNTIHNYHKRGFLKKFPHKIFLCSKMDLIKIKNITNERPKRP